MSKVVSLVIMTMLILGVVATGCVSSGGSSKGPTVTPTSSSTGSILNTSTVSSHTSTSSTSKPNVPAFITVSAIIGVIKNNTEVSEWSYAGTIDYKERNANVEMTHKYNMNVRNITGNWKTRIISINDGKLEYIMIVPPAERTLPSNADLRKRIVNEVFNENPYVVLVSITSGMVKENKNAVSSTYNVTLSVKESQDLMRSIGMNQSVPTVQLRGTVTFRNGKLFMAELKGKEGNTTYNVIVELTSGKE